MAHVSFTWIGASAERSSAVFYLPAINAGNFDAVTGEGAAENVGEIKSAIDDITLMNNVKRSVVAVEYTDAPTLPSNQFAQRELKLLVTYVDNTTAKTYRVSIPGPDLSLIAQAGTDVVDHTSNVLAAALVTALETYAVSPDGNAITVIGMRIVGRNV